MEAVPVSVGDGDRALVPAPASLQSPLPGAARRGVTTLTAVSPALVGSTVLDAV